MPWSLVRLDESKFAAMLFEVTKLQLEGCKLLFCLRQPGLLFKMLRQLLGQDRGFFLQPPDLFGRPFPGGEVRIPAALTLQERLLVFRLAQRRGQKAKAALRGGELFENVLRGGVVVRHHLDRFPPQQQVGEDIQDGLGFPGAGRPLDHADLILQGAMDGGKLTGVPAKGENQAAAGVLLDGMRFGVQVNSQGGFSINKGYAVILLFQEDFALTASQCADCGQCAQVCQAVRGLRFVQAADGSLKAASQIGPSCSVGKGNVPILVVPLAAKGENALNIAKGYSVPGDLIQRRVEGLGVLITYDGGTPVGIGFSAGKGNIIPFCLGIIAAKSNVLSAVFSMDEEQVLFLIHCVPPS